MSKSDDEKLLFPDYTAERGNSIIAPDKTVIRPKNAAHINKKSAVPESVTEREDKTVIRKVKQPATDQAIQRGAGHAQVKRPVAKSDVTRVPVSNNKQNHSDATRIPPSAASTPSLNAGSGVRGQTPNQPRVDATRIPSKTPAVGQSAHGGSQHRILKNRFLLEKVLGVGGMGVVYKAKDRLKVEAQDRDPYVAIKVLNEEFKSHPDAFISLQRESRKAQRLSQPNIVKVYDFDRDGDVVFMTMEYMEGKPLDQLIKQYNATGLPWDDAMEIIKGISSALSHAHAENIIHSDFKPGNIFVTTSGIAKVFDFGIARAVTQVDRNDGKVIDKTVFDAGTLGALTPAYASMEMLQGEVPDIRDDIYALGCIVYEILTGKHPFNKMPADEACQKGLKPKRIATISKRQWRALEKLLSFNRSDRIESADEFFQLFSTKFKPSYLAAASIALIAMLSITVYVINDNKGGISEHDLRNEMEYKIRFDLFKEEIKRLVTNPTFTIDWEEDLWREVSGVGEMLTKNDGWFVSTRRDIFILYIEKIRENRAEVKLARTRILIDNAARYTDDKNVLNDERSKLAQAVAVEERQKKLYADNARKEKRSKLVKEEENKQNHDSFNVALENVNKQLQCQSRLSMRNFDIAIKKLRSLNAARYQKMERKIVSSLSACITVVGHRFPEQAEESKRYALKLFNNNPQILAVIVKPKDACDQSIAGLGKYGKRGVCRDKVRGLGEGPDLVVVPRGKNFKAFAIGKYEVTIGEINRFCKKTTSCSVVARVNESMPATNIPLSTTKLYLRWLSKNSGRKYRLPTKREWVYASSSSNDRHDPNRNCQLSSRGIQKGGDLVNTTTGQQNSWGLVNYLGNAQEWVYAKGGKLVTVGGSYRDSMDKCNISSWSLHSGNADKMTGFRLLRELKEQ